MKDVGPRLRPGPPLLILLSIPRPQPRRPFRTWAGSELMSRFTHGGRTAGGREVGGAQDESCGPSDLGRVIPTGDRLRGRRPGPGEVPRAPPADDGLTVGGT